MPVIISIILSAAFIGILGVLHCELPALIALGVLFSFINLVVFSTWCANLPDER